MSEVEIIGLRALLKDFDQAPKQIRKLVLTAMGDSVEAVYKRATTYPPRRPSSSYVRTGRLQSQWQHTIETGANDITGRVFNVKTPYGKWVMGAETQARVHKGRWYTTADIVREQQPKINRFFEAAMDKVVQWLKR